MRFNILSLVLSLVYLIRAQDTAPSPPASIDLICHTSHPSDCYPRVFQPTTAFEPIRDDQSLPPGLHIRLNLETGRKEARLNLPTSSSVDESSDLVIIEESEPVVDSSYAPGLLDQTSPRRHLETGESALFATSSSILRSAPPTSPALLPALSTLEDLSHSHQWGLTLARDKPTVHKLVELFAVNTTDHLVRGAAALVLGTAIQNNPAALSAAMCHFYNDEWPTGPLESILAALAYERLPQLLVRAVFLLSALSQEPVLVWNFVKVGGLDLLVQVYEAEQTGQDGKDRLRGKIANFLLDHFSQVNDHVGGYDSTHVSEEKKVDEELESFLEKEDPWIMPNNRDDSIVLRQDSEAEEMLSHQNVIRGLKSWCSALRTSLRKWGSKGQESDSASASESVQEAYMLLQEKLEAHGYSCDQDASFQAI